MRWLIDRIRAALRALQTVPYRPARVGVLNTGELVMVDGLGQSTIFSTETTGLMRAALIDNEPDTSEIVIPVGGVLQTCGDARTP